MNIKLINPSINTWSPNLYQPMGLAIIAAVLEQAGHKLQIIDLGCTPMSNKQLVKELTTADIVGITGLITTKTEVIRLANLAKKVNPKVKVILGGPLVTTQAREVLPQSKADYAVVGEGELVISNLVKALDSNQDTTGIKGIAYMVDGQIKLNPREEIIDNLDALPFPARHLLDMSRYTGDYYRGYGSEYKKVKSTIMFTSRGCPYHCCFCYQGVWGHKWRGRSADSIISEMVYLNKTYGYTGFVINDDTFIMNRKRVIEFCNKLLEQNLKFYWTCSGRVNLMTEDLIILMARAGCRSIGVGIEAGNQDIINIIEKDITLEEAEKVCKYTEAAGIHVIGLFMIGMLGETRETIKQTLDFARKIHVSSCNFTITTPLIGTPLYDMAVEKGFKVQRDGNQIDWCNHGNVNLTKDCTMEELEAWNEQALKEFTIIPRYGKYYLFNPTLWIDGFRTMTFLIGKRPVKELILRALKLVTG